MPANPFDPSSPLVQELIRRTVAQDTTPAATPAATAAHSSAKGPMIASAVGDAADILSTNWGLRNNPNRHETNPLLSSDPTKNALGQIAADIGMEVLIHHLSQNHPTLAKILGYGSGAFGAAGTAYTLTHSHQAGPSPQRSGIAPAPGNTYNGALTPGAPDINLK